MFSVDWINLVKAGLVAASKSYPDAEAIAPSDAGTETSTETGTEKGTATGAGSSTGATSAAGTDAGTEKGAGAGTETGTETGAGAKTGEGGASDAGNNSFLTELVEPLELRALNLHGVTLLPLKISAPSNMSASFTATSCRSKWTWSC